MAAGFIRHYRNDWLVVSAGTKPDTQINPLAVQVMRELGIDISTEKPKTVELFIEEPFDYVITVCDAAKEVCPVFTGEVTYRLHKGFEDPAEAKGTQDEQLSVYRRVRDEIKEAFEGFVENFRFE
jgi:arsenate reductase